MGRNSLTIFQILKSESRSKGIRLIMLREKGQMLDTNLKMMLMGMLGWLIGYTISKIPPSPAIPMIKVPKWLYFICGKPRYEAMPIGTVQPLALLFQLIGTLWTIGLLLGVFVPPDFQVCTNSFIPCGGLFSMGLLIWLVQRQSAR
jgi:hypothetical protein